MVFSTFTVTITDDVWIILHNVFYTNDFIILIKHRKSITWITANNNVNDKAANAYSNNLDTL